METQLHLEADTTGQFHGQSANISGSGFSGMTFTTESTTAESFDAWVASVKSRSNPLTFSRYNALSQPSSYVPPIYYSSAEQNLFGAILLKYMSPTSGGYFSAGSGI